MNSDFDGSFTSQRKFLPGDLFMKINGFSHQPQLHYPAGDSWSCSCPCTETKSVWTCFSLLPEEETNLTGKWELNSLPVCHILFYSFYFYMFWRSDQSRFPGELPTVIVNIFSHSSLLESLSVFMLFSVQRTSWSLSSAGSLFSSVLQCFLRVNKYGSCSTQLCCNFSDKAEGSNITWSITSHINCDLTRDLSTYCSWHCYLWGLWLAL